MRWPDHLRSPFPGRSCQRARAFTRESLRIRVSANSRFGDLKQTSSRPPGGFSDAKTSSETLRKRNGSFPSVKSDSPNSPGSPREAQTPVLGTSNKHLQGLSRAFLTPKRPPKRCENATVRSQVSILIFPPPWKAPGKLKLPFWGSQTNVFKASRGLF